MMWNKVKLRDICKIFDDGNWIETKDQSNDGIRLIQTGNIKFGTFADRKNKARYISDKTFKNLNCKEIFAGDILISRLPEPVGRACIIPKLSERAITAVDCTIIRLKEICLPEYLNYYMQSPQYFIDIRKEISGATRQRISRKNLGEILITLPPLEKQQHIISKLNTAFSYIDNLVEITHKKDLEIINLNSCLLKREFCEEKYNLKIDKILPFEQCLKKITTLPKVQKKNYLKKGSFPIISQEASLISGYSNNSKAVYNIKKPVIVFGDHTRVLKYIDFSFVSGADGTKIISPIDGLETKYLYYLLKYKMPKGSGYARHYSLLKKIKIIIPSLKIQRRIITKLDRCTLELNKAFEFIEKNKQNHLSLKSKILSKVLQGKAA
jgi:type I restriction enzyme, S subunit